MSSCGYANDPTSNTAKPIPTDETAITSLIVFHPPGSFSYADNGARNADRTPVRSCRPPVLIVRAKRIELPDIDACGNLTRHPVIIAFIVGQYCTSGFNSVAG